MQRKSAERQSLSSRQIGSLRRKFREHIDYISSLGAQVKELTFTGKRHIKITISLAGKERYIISANTASNRRSFLQWKSDARQVVKELQTS